MTTKTITAPAVAIGALSRQAPGRRAVGYLGFGVVGFVVVFEQQAPQQFPHAQAIAHLQFVVR